MTDQITREFQIRIRYAHTDKMGVVYNGNYLTFFEIGRTELLRSIGLPYAQLELAGFMLPVLEAHVEFKSPAFYDDMVTIVTTVNTKHSAVLTISYLVNRDDHTLASGYTKHSFVSAGTWRPIKPPAMFTKAITMATESAELQQ